MEVEDLIKQQARVHGKLKETSEKIEDSIGNKEENNDVDEIYNILHKRGIVKISNGVTISSF